MSLEDAQQVQGFFMLGLSAFAWLWTIVSLGLLIRHELRGRWRSKR